MIIKTPPGYSCLFVSPLNNKDDRFEIISGIVDTDTYENFINFPIVINGDKYPNLETTIERGTPYVQIIPFKRDDWKMEIGSKRVNVALTSLTILRKIWNNYKTFFGKRKMELERFIKVFDNTMEPRIIGSCLNYLNTLNFMDEKIIGYDGESYVNKDVRSTQGWYFESGTMTDIHWRNFWTSNFRRLFFEYKKFYDIYTDIECEEIKTLAVLKYKEEIFIFHILIVTIVVQEL